MKGQKEMLKKKLVVKIDLDDEIEINEVTIEIYDDLSDNEIEEILNRSSYVVSYPGGSDMLTEEENKWLDENDWFAEVTCGSFMWYLERKYGWECSYGGFSSKHDEYDFEIMM